MWQTGHRSTDAVRRYKRPCAEHQLQVSRILQPPPVKKAATAHTATAGQEKEDPTLSLGTLGNAITFTSKKVQIKIFTSTSASSKTEHKMYQTNQTNKECL